MTVVYCTEALSLLTTFGNETHINCLKYRGLAYSNQERYQSAIDDYLEILQLSPDEEWASKNLSVVRKTLEERQRDSSSASSIGMYGGKSDSSSSMSAPPHNKR